MSANHKRLQALITVASYQPYDLEAETLVQRSLRTSGGRCAPAPRDPTGRKPENTYPAHSPPSSQSPSGAS